MKMVNWYRMQSVALTLLGMLLLSACTGPGNDAAKPDLTVNAPAARANPPIADRATLPGLPGSVSLTCKTNADCAIKDIGSCCGYQPRCLNKDSLTFPEQVKAQCAKEGRMSTCGFLAITGCECVAGKCAGIPLSDNSNLVQ